MDSYTLFGHIVGIVGVNQCMQAHIELSGLGVLPNLEVVFEKASVETKHQLLSSILAEKLALTGAKYRTPVFKEGFNLIFNSINQLQDKKPKTGDRIAAISRLVPGAGLEPARP
jgi:hypothetical protein